MTQSDKLDYLIHRLVTENGQIPYPCLTEGEYNKTYFLRALLNVRLPAPASKEFMQIQDEYLQAEIAAKGITDAANLSVLSKNERIAIWKGDITTLKVGAVVNAANSRMLGCFYPNHGCIDNAIHTYAGIQLRESCENLLKGQVEKIGKARITPAFNLPADFILHTVGPSISGRLTENDCKQLAECYASCLQLAAGNRVESVAFCCISTGEFHFPSQKAAEIAISTVIDFLQTNLSIKKVIFNVYKQSDYEIYQKLLQL